MSSFTRGVLVPASSEARRRFERLVGAKVAADLARPRPFGPLVCAEVLVAAFLAGVGRAAVAGSDLDLGVGAGSALLVRLDDRVTGASLGALRLGGMMQDRS